MKNRWLGWISLVTLVSVTLWITLLIWDLATAGPLETFEQVLAHTARQDWKFTATYLNAGIFTLGATALMGGLYTFCKPQLPGWSRIGLIFVPVYCTLNLSAYLSQITLVPILLKAAENPATQNSAYLLLELSIQLWPNSVSGFFNGLAYAVLGIPAFIFGLGLLKGRRALRISGWMLIINAATCLIGVIGILIENRLLANGVVLGGAFFWLALFPLTVAFFREVE